MMKHQKKWLPKRLRSFSGPLPTICAAARLSQCRRSCCEAAEAVLHRNRERVWKADPLPGQARFHSSPRLSVQGAPSHLRQTPEIHSDFTEMVSTRRIFKPSTGSGDVDRETLEGYARTLIKAGDAAKEVKTEVFSFIILSFLKFTFP